MKFRTILCMIAGMFLLLTVAACGGSGEPEVTPTDAPLTIWEYESVCRQGTIDEATAYDPNADVTVHPILLFKRGSTDTNTYSSMDNFTLKLPEPWMVDYEGDATTVELVGCITHVSDEFVASCDFSDDEDDASYILNIYNVNYEVKVFVATTGEELGITTINATFDECPMMHMFSENEEDSFAYLEGGDLQPFLAQFVEP